MKKLNRFILSAAFVFLLNNSFAQHINWKNLQPSQKHLINLNLGFDHGSSVGIGYGYHINTKMPLVLGIDYSMPFGKEPFDDFKTRIGGQLNLIRTNSFFTAVKAYSVFRRFENEFARMVNFGSEFSATAGIYKNKWFAAAELGFDKAITTHLKHSSLMKEYNPLVESGWYIPTGGNFLYGIQGGFSGRGSDLYVRLGRTLAQDFKTKPSVPYYFQLGWTTKW